MIAEDEQVEEKKRRSAGWYIWRILTLAVTTLLLFIFIKGWVDGDVDVSFSFFFSLLLGILQNSWIGFICSKFNILFQFGNALQSAFRGGLSGAAAMFLQVLLLMVSYPGITLSSQF